MRYYDITNIKATDQRSKRLGFSRIFHNGTDIDVQDAGRPARRCTIATGSNESLLARSIKERNVMGILPKNPPSKKLLAMLADTGKILFVNVNDTIKAEGSQQFKAIYLNRKTMHYCRKFKVAVSPITLADSEEYLLSSKQLAAFLKFLGFSGNDKIALNALGAAYGKKNKE